MSEGVAVTGHAAAVMSGVLSPSSNSCADLPDDLCNALKSKITCDEGAKPVIAPQSSFLSYTRALTFNGKEYSPSCAFKTGSDLATEAEAKTGLPHKWFVGLGGLGRGVLPFPECNPDKSVNEIEDQGSVSWGHLARHCANSLHRLTGLSYVVAKESSYVYLVIEKDTAAKQLETLKKEIGTFLVEFLVEE